LAEGSSIPDIVFYVCGAVISGAGGAVVHGQPIDDGAPHAA
jgi:hypothetical protein